MKALLVALPAAKLLLQLATLPGYGFFRDEFYYAACSERLAFGYVDHPPLSVLVLRVVRALLGDSIWALRLVPALAGAATVLVVGLIARRLGGGPAAQAVAMVAAIAAPAYLAANHYYSMNSLDLLLWAVAAYLLSGLLQNSTPRRWLLLGLVLGLGLQNKVSVLWLGFGIAVGLLLTPRRRELLTRWPWAAGLVALLIFLPHLLWQHANGWPTLEFIRNATQQKMVAVALGSFLRSQVWVMNPGAAPFWLAGLFWLLVSERGRPFRLLGWVYVAVAALLALSGSSRPGYLAPAYTWLFAAGGVVLEQLGRRWLVVAATAVIVASGLVRAPFALPLLPVETYVAYARTLGVAPSTAEKKQLAALPQWYADMHGWDSIVGTVARVYLELPPEDRQGAIVFTQNYGVAGAVEFLGRRLGLPPAYSGHNNYWFWGLPDPGTRVVIVVGGDEEDHRQVFREVERKAATDCGYCMPYENHNPVFVCRGLKVSLQQIWPHLKHYD